jgi:uncharacterized protein GlcG (DUF336 family)
MNKRLTALNFKGLLLAMVLLAVTLPPLASLAQSTESPTINVQACAFDAGQGRLMIKGANFQKGASVTLMAHAGQVAHGGVKVKGEAKIIVNAVSESDLAGGLDVTVTNPDGSTVTAHLDVTALDTGQLTETDVKQIIAQAVAQAEAAGLKATIAVVDKEGNILGIFQMTGANPEIIIKPPKTGPRVGAGLEGPLPAASRPFGAVLAAISKAVTGSFLSSQGHSFTTRTASFIVQEHFPPGVHFQAGGPLFGVQFSQLLVCSDVNPRAPLGLSADPGGIALYKNGVKVGGVGVEGDGVYTFDDDPSDNDQPVEERVALGATRGFETPPEIQADKIIVNGIRFPFVNTPMPPEVPTPSFDSLPGTVINLEALAPGLAPGIRGAQPSNFSVTTLDPSIPAGRVDSRFAIIGGSALSKGEVKQILVQAAAQAFKTRAAIRQPENSPAEVNITVCDVDGKILGIFSTIDAPIFGFDVSAQKARTAAFFSNANAGTKLRQAGFGNYVDAAAKDGLHLDGSVAFSDRAGGFLSRPFFPDGIDGTEHGPFSVPIETFSPFNDGLQLDLLNTNNGAIRRFLKTLQLTPNDCTGIPGIANGTQIFPGSVPLYKGGTLVGGLGISGDGVDQDDIIATMGSAGFESPPEMRSDRVFVRGVRLPFVKFPRHPDR